MKPLKNKQKYVIVSPSGEVKINFLREYRADSLMDIEYALGVNWKEARSYGWKCKKVYLNVTEEKL